MGTCRPAKPHSNLPRLATCTFGHLVGTVRFKIVQSERLTLKRKWVFFCQIAGFFNRQYLWKEPINALDIVYRDSYQEKTRFKAIIIGWV